MKIDNDKDRIDQVESVLVDTLRRWGESKKKLEIATIALERIKARCPLGKGLPNSDIYMIAAEALGKL